MSHVSTVIIVLPSGSRPETPLILEALNKYLMEQELCSRPIRPPVPDEFISGTKCLEETVLVGAFNYFTEEHFYEVQEIVHKGLGQGARAILIWREPDCPPRVSYVRDI